MRYRVYELAVDPPIPSQAGDRIEITTDSVRVWRGETLIAERPVVLPGHSIESGEVAWERQLTSVFLIKEIAMAPVSATLTQVVVTESGVYKYQFSNGTEREFATRQDALDAVQYLDTEVEIPQDLLILGSLRRDNSGSNPNVLSGRCCTIDGAAQLPVSLSLGIEAT